MSKPLDVTLSIEIAQRIKSKAKDAFNNAYKAALLMEGATYVQGFLAFAGKRCTPLEHGWIELENCIVDPTWPHFSRSAEEAYYFPAQRLSVKKLKAAVEEAKEDYPDDDPLPVYGSQPYEYYGDVMLGGKEYLQAHEEANAKCQEIKALDTKQSNGSDGNHS